jgi:hypothetical protein
MNLGQEQDLNSRVFKAEDARQALEHPLWRDAFKAVAAHLELVALSCDPDNEKKAQRVVISMQLLKAVKRELERVVEDGEFAKVEIRELEKRKGLLRFVR